MLQILKDFLNEVGIGDKPAHRFDRNDDRLAAAALLIHVMTVDGKETPEELDKLHDLLKSRFDLDDDATAELIEEATAADRESVDLYRFTSQLLRSLDEDGRRRIVKMMWQMVYADGNLNEFEDNIVWRASDLLGISTRDRVELRREVVAESGKVVDDA
ncbi:MAG: TerB family tellurite resistance protein [Pseudorhodoplanes sp.]